MKNKLNFSAEEVISQNLNLCLLTVSFSALAAIFAKTYHPLKIGFTTTIIFSIILFFIPFLLDNVSNNISLLLLQLSIFFLLIPGAGLLEAVFFIYFPVSRRFRFIATTFGFASPIGKVIISFGLIPIINYFGNYGIWFFLVPAAIIVFVAINYFKKLEKERGWYDNYPEEDLPYDDTAKNEEEFEYDDLGDEYSPFASGCQHSQELISKLELVSKEENKKLNMSLIKKATVFAKKWHAGQMRKTGDLPFYSHPLKVAEMVGERYPKTDVIIGAILHDVVEDSNCSIELIEEKFNKRIAQLVDRLTRKRIKGKIEIKMQLEEVIEMLKKVGDNEALFIKEMDRLHNLQTIKGLSQEKQKKIAVETSNCMVKEVSIIADRLNVYDKVNLENKLLKYSKGVLNKNF